MGACERDPALTLVLVRFAKHDWSFGNPFLIQWLRTPAAQAWRWTFGKWEWPIACRTLSVAVLSRTRCAHSYKKLIGVNELNRNMNMTNMTWLGIWIGVWTYYVDEHLCAFWRFGVDTCMSVFPQTSCVDGIHTDDHISQFDRSGLACLNSQVVPARTAPKACHSCIQASFIVFPFPVVEVERMPKFDSQRWNQVIAFIPSNQATRPCEGLGAVTPPCIVETWLMLSDFVGSGGLRAKMTNQVSLPLWRSHHTAGFQTGQAAGMLKPDGWWAKGARVGFFKGFSFVTLQLVFSADLDDVQHDCGNDCLAPVWCILPISLPISGISSANLCVCYRPICTHSGPWLGTAGSRAHVRSNP